MRVLIASVEALLARLTSRVLLVSILFVAIFSLAAVPPLDPDLWWHLANGRLMLSSGWPHSDVFSFSASGHPWIVHEWLADLLMFLSYRAGGLPFLVVIFALVVMSGAVCLYLLLRWSGLHPTACVLVTLAGALAGSTAWGARPQLLNLLFAGLLLCGLHRFRQGRLGVWFLPPFLWLWANLHSGFLIGVIISALFLAGEAFDCLRTGEGISRPRLKQLGMALGAGVALSLVNPYGVDTIIFPLGTLTSPQIQANIQEWASPDFHTVAGLLLEAIVFILLFGLATRRVRIRTSEWLLTAALLYLAFSSQRHVPLFILAAAPLTGRCAQALIELAASVLPARPNRPAAAVALRATPARFRPANLLALGAVNLVLLVMVGAGMVGYRALPNLMPSKEAAAISAAEPVSAIDRLLASNPSARLFNYYDFGGYALWRIYPSGGRVFIDGRVEVYGPQIFNQYLAVSYVSANWAQVIQRYRPDAVLMPNNHPLVTLLAADPGWQVLARDRVATVFTRVGSTP